MILSRNDNTFSGIKTKTIIIFIKIKQLKLTRGEIKSLPLLIIIF